MARNFYFRLLFPVCCHLNWVHAGNVPNKVGEAGPANRGSVIRSAVIACRVASSGHAAILQRTCRGLTRLQSKQGDPNGDNGHNPCAIRPDARPCVPAGTWYPQDTKGRLVYCSTKCKANISPVFEAFHSRRFQGFCSIHPPRYWGVWGNQIGISKMLIDCMLFTDKRLINPPSLWVVPSLFLTAIRC